jgi:hypothetical protein
VVILAAHYPMGVPHYLNLWSKDEARLPHPPGPFCFCSKCCSFFRKPVDPSLIALPPVTARETEQLRGPLLKRKPFIIPTESQVKVFRAVHKQKRAVRHSSQRQVKPVVSPLVSLPPGSAFLYPNGHTGFFEPKFRRVSTAKVVICKRQIRSFRRELRTFSNFEEHAYDLDFLFSDWSLPCRLSEAVQDESVVEVFRRGLRVGGAGNCWKRLPFVPGAIGVPLDSYAAALLEIRIAEDDPEVISAESVLAALCEYLEDDPRYDFGVSVGFDNDGDIHINYVRGPISFLRSGEINLYMFKEFLESSLYFSNNSFDCIDLSDSGVFLNDRRILVGSRPHIHETVTPSIATPELAIPFLVHALPELAVKFSRHVFEFVHSEIAKRLLKHGIGLTPTPGLPAPIDDLPFIKPDWWQLILDRSQELVEAVRRSLSSVIPAIPDDVIEIIANLRELVSYFVSLMGDRLIEIARFVCGFFEPIAGFTASFIGEMICDFFKFGASALVSSIDAASCFHSVIRLIAMLSQDFGEYHGPDHLYSRTTRSGLLCFAELADKRGVAPAFSEQPIATGPSRHVVQIMSDMNDLSAGNRLSESVMLRMVAEDFDARVNNLPALVLPSDTPDDILDEFQKHLPGFNVCPGVNTRPHPRSAAIRYAFRRISANEVGKHGVPVLAVGASAEESLAIPNLIHNCAPILSGRDCYRHFHRRPDSRTIYERCSHDHVFEQCNQNGLGDVESTHGCLIWSHFSAHDISPTDFIRAMVKNGSTTALVALQLPFPLLDLRVTTYVDEVTGWRYERVGDRLNAFPLDGHSAGYSHRWETVRQWMSNLPIFDNAHVQMEAIAQVGTIVLTKLSVAPGSQEVIPSIWSCQREGFYVLPELLDRDLMKDNPHYFVVSAHRFNQLVTFVASLKPVDREHETILAKIRGMTSAVRIGKFKIDPRWILRLSETYSLVAHSLSAHKLYQQSVKRKSATLAGYYKRQHWRNGNWLQRMVQSRIDALTFRVGGEADPVDMTTFTEWFFNDALDHKHTFNPYQLAGEYRLINAEEAPSNHTRRLEFSTLAISGSMVRMAVQTTNKIVNVAFNGLLNQFARPAAVVVDAQESDDSGSYETVNDHLSLHAAEIDPADIPLPDDSDDWLSAASEVAESVPALEVERSHMQSDADSVEQMSMSTTEGSIEYVDLPPPVQTHRAHVDPLFAVTEAIPPVENRNVGILAPDHISIPDQTLPAQIDVIQTPHDNNVAFLARSDMLWGMNDAEINPRTDRQIDFDAPLDLTNCVHDIDHEYKARFGNFLPRFSTATRVPCPSNGGVQILTAWMSSRENFRMFPSIDKLISADDFYTAFASTNPDVNAREAINGKLKNFVKYVYHEPKIMNIKTLLVEGPAMSAKSTLVRKFISKMAKKTLVIVPSSQLSEQWSKHSVNSPNSHLFVRSGSRFTTLRSSGSEDPTGFKIGVIDEVYAFKEIELMAHIQMFVRAGVDSVVLIGDRCQATEPKLPASIPLLSARLDLHTSLGMPQDAHSLFVRINDLDPKRYGTTGTIRRSIYLSPLINVENYPNRARFHQFQESKSDLSIGQIQGSRFDTLALDADTSMSKVSWLTSQKAMHTIAVTRHTDKLLICGPQAVYPQILMSRFLKQIKWIEGERHAHTFVPKVADVLIKPDCSIDGRFEIASGMPMVPDFFKIEKIPTESVPRGRVANGLVEPVQPIIDANTNFSLLDPTEIDFVVDDPVSCKICPPGPPVQRTDVRSPFKNAHLMAAIHHNSSAFDSAKNLLERQLASVHSSKIDENILREAVKMHERFRECYYNTSCTIFPDADLSLNWLKTRLSSNVAQLYAGEPFLESSRSLLVDAEFKTQSKAKAKPGFAATLPYGQSILANSKNFNAFFSREQQKLYLNGQKLMRPGVFIDYGMTDDELSDSIRSLGYAEKMAGPLNLQADLSKQDSSHNAYFCAQFLLFCRDCGFDEDFCNFYLHYSSRYKFVSRGEDAVAGFNCFNLGSGDPFTLIRNCVMEMMVIAMTFTAANTGILVEKGDDVHGVFDHYGNHKMVNHRAMNGVTLTFEIGSVGYHAGRFHSGYRYLVDPARAFLKHLTRLNDQSVTVKELYSSFLSRATDYDETEVEFLLRAIPLHYDFFDQSDASAIINFILGLREYKNFVKSQTPPPGHVVVVDAKRDCLSNCVRLVRPGKPRSFYNRFNHLEKSEATLLLRSLNIPFVDVTLHPGFSVVKNVIYLDDKHAKIYL